jgi:hypothetical protein
VEHAVDVALRRAREHQHVSHHFRSSRAPAPSPTLTRSPVSAVGSWNDFDAG